MLIENIYNQIAEIEREIAILPEGSITKNAHEYHSEK